ncbi:MAG: FliM/FliN family flagellar motor C-terminal domain-containing protein [Marinovum sp.]|nr:FliM/FliN family flagellar motor C-terminal domain-containing protein [Marinovum sp.]
MGEAAHSNALRRKASAGHRVREAEGLSPARALRLAVARSAGDLWELPLTVTGVRHELIGLEDLHNHLSDECITLLLDGPDGCVGGLSVDRDVLTSVTEVQTIGRVTERAPQERPYTDTDAALFAPLIDDVMQRLDMMLGGEVTAEMSNSSRWIIGYRFGAMVENVRALSLALDGYDFHLLSFDLDVAAGMRRGKVTLCLPESFTVPSSNGEDGDDCPGEFSESMSLVPAELDATLARVTMPLARATALKVGDTVQLSPKALQEVTLCASDGQFVARGQLGKADGMRAIKLGGKSKSDAIVVEEGQVQAFEAAARSASPPMSSSANLAGLSESMGASDIPAIDIPDIPAMPDLPAEPVGDELDLPDLPPLDFGEDGAEDLPDLPDLPALPDLPSLN